MNLARFASAACLVACFAVATPATAAPLVPDRPSAPESHVVPVRGCHGDVRRHYVPQFGRTVTHRHRRDCRPVRVRERHRDCHRDARRHYVPGYGRVVHRHVGPDCRIRVLRRWDGPGGRDCVRIGPIRYCVR